MITQDIFRIVLTFAILSYWLTQVCVASPNNNENSSSQSLITSQTLNELETTSTHQTNEGVSHLISMTKSDILPFRYQNTRMLESNSSLNLTSSHRNSNSNWSPSMTINLSNLPASHHRHTIQEEEGEIPIRSNFEELNAMIPVYKNGTLTSEFDEETWNTACCSSPDLYSYFFNSSMQPALLIRNENATHPLWLTQFSIQAEITTGIQPKLRAPANSPALIRIESGSTTQLNVDVPCFEPYDADNYWTAISIDLAFSPSSSVDAPMVVVSVYFFYVCDEQFRPTKYEVSLALLTIVLVIFVYFLAMYSTPRSLICNRNFRRFEVKWYHAWIYAFMLGFIVALDQIFGAKPLKQFIDISMAVIAGAAAWFFTSEIQCTFVSYHARVKKVLFRVSIFSFQVMDIISALASAILLTLQFYSGKAWYCSNLLALCVLGSIMKLLKFKALKQAYGFLLICLIVDALGGFLVYISQALSYDSIFINNYNQPFLIAVPIWKMFYDKACSWLPVLGIAFPGVLINLCFRFDRSQKNVSTKAFTYIGSIGYILGTMIYIISTMFNKHSWPYSLINFPVMSLFIYLFAYKRGDHLILWHGSFYDFDSSRKVQPRFSEEDDDNYRKDHLQESSEQYTFEQNSKLFDGLTLFNSAEHQIHSSDYFATARNTYASRQTKQQQQQLQNQSLEYSRNSKKDNELNEESIEKKKNNNIQEETQSDPSNGSSSNCNSSQNNNNHGNYHQLID